MLKSWEEIFRDKGGSSTGASTARPRLKFFMGVFLEILTPCIEFIVINMHAMFIIYILFSALTTKA